jgi:hypothetical protein
MGDGDTGNYHDGRSPSPSSSLSMSPCPSLPRPYLGMGGMTTWLMGFTFIPPGYLRHVLAVRPEALTAHARIFVEEIARWQKQRATARGIDDGETGAVIFVQRFNATLQSFVHLHVIAIDGVFTRETRGGPAAFHEGRAPATSDVAAVAGRVAKRMRRWLRRRGLVEERAADERSVCVRCRSPRGASGESVR